VRLKCVKCRWMGSFMKPETVLRLSQEGVRCPNCGELLVLHFNSEPEEHRFEAAIAAGAPR